MIDVFIEIIVLIIENLLSVMIMSQKKIKKTTNNFNGLRITGAILKLRTNSKDAISVRINTLVIFFKEN